MDQTIGIGYGVSGVDAVVQENNRVIGSFEKVSEKIGAMTQRVSTFGAAMAGMQKSMGGMAGMSMTSWTEGSATLKTAASRATSFKDALIGLPRRAYAAASAIDKLTGSISGYVVQMQKANVLTRSFGAQSMGGMVPGGKGGTSAATGSMFPSLGRVPGYMLGWRLASEGLRAAHFTLTDIILGQSREGLAKGLGELSAVGMSGTQKQDMELSAKKFSQKFWTVSAEKYIEALSYTASGFNINEIGATNLTKLHEASMKMSMVAKMSAEKSAAMMTKSVLAIVAQLPSEIADKLRAGEAGEVPQLGKVTIGELGEKLTAQYLKAMKTTMMWGPDIQSAFKYALPNFLEMGWSPAGALAFTGSLVNAGFHAGQSGRGIKDIFVKEEGTFAKIYVKGLGYWQEEGQFDKNTGRELTGTERKINREMNRRYIEEARGVVHKSLQQPETAAQILSGAGELYRKLTDPAQGGKETSKTLGVSTQFQPLFLTYTKKSFEDEMVKAKERIASADYAQTDEIVTKSIEDVGLSYQRIMNSFKNLSTSMADYPGAAEIAAVIAKPLDLLRTQIDLGKKVLRGGGNGGAMTAGEIAEFQLQNGKELESVFGVEETDRLKRAMWDTWRTGRGGGALQAILDMLPGTRPDNAFSLDPGATFDKLSSLQMNDFLTKDQEQAIQPVVNFFQGLAKKWEETDVLSTAVDYFWDHTTYPFYAAAKAMDEAEELLKAAVLGPINKIIEVFSGIGTKVESFLPHAGPSEPPPQDAVPGVPNIPFVPYAAPSAYYGSQEPPVVHLTSQIDNNMIIDGRVLAMAVAEIIQTNRDVHYHGFGGDPMGFVT